jgi:hypothetical protein
VTLQVLGHVVERVETYDWISRNRRLARDFERYAATVAAFVRNSSGDRAEDLEKLEFEWPLMFGACQSDRGYFG